jgi:hypothetical protein
MFSISNTDIEKNIELSEEVKETCRILGLQESLSIVNFFTSEAHFTDIEHLGKKVRKQIINSCINFLNQEKNGRPNFDISLKLLTVYENISLRAINICKDNGISTISEILEYRQVYKDFKSSRNCGVKTNDELLYLCEKYNNFYIIKPDVVNEEDEEIQIELIDNIKLQALAKIEDMSCRSYNVCLDAGLTSLRLIIQHYHNNKKYGFLKCRNCGVTTNNELINICRKYENSIVSLKRGKQDFIDVFSPVDEFINSLRLDAKYYSEVKDIISKPNKIPLFKIIDLLIEKKLLYKNENEIFIFKNIFNFYQNFHRTTLGEVGNQLDLTRERVRQIKEQIILKLPNKFNFLYKIPYQLLSNYDYISFRHLVFISGEDASTINKIEGTNFSALFITYILSIVFDYKYATIGDFESLSINRIRGNKEFQMHLYLIDKDLNKDYDFNKYFSDLFWSINQKLQQDLFISFEEIISSYQLNQSINFEGTIDVIKSIIEIDFNKFIKVQIDGLILKSNSRKTFTLHIMEILQNSYKPLHYSEIYQQMIDSGINISSEQSLHSLLNRENEIFGLKGAGIFDLLSKGGYFGSIGDVAEQMLIDTGNPIYIKDLENIICNELIVSKDSIRTVLFSYENENRFILSRDGYVKLRKWQRV